MNNLRFTAEKVVLILDFVLIVCVFLMVKYEHENKLSIIFCINQIFFVPLQRFRETTKKINI